METHLINKLTVHQMLNRYPESIKIFIRYSPECIGCAFERFCTMEDVTKAYDLPPTEWGDAISEVINQTNKRRST
ncbi:MAG: hypothetical protein P8Y72_04135 [Anaerolineales bacterium]|jgi:hypothetical protein